MNWASERTVTMEAGLPGGCTGGKRFTTESGKIKFPKRGHGWLKQIAWKPMGVGENESNEVDG